MAVGVPEPVPERPATSAEMGLRDAEVAARVAAGRTNAVELPTSRTVTDIVRANVFTFFNGLLLVLFVVIAATGRWQNGLFGLVIVANAGIGIVQELRAKRTLDRLAVVTAPHARVVRNGSLIEVDPGELVEDDLVEVRIGDQVTADGVVRSASSLEVDESLLTGESEPVAKTVGDLLRSGSVVVAGSGRFQATAVGAASYASGLSFEARRFKLAGSELVAVTNRLLRWIAVAMLVVGPVLLWGQFTSHETQGWREAVTGTVAALVGMVPEGLVLLTSLAFMVAVITLAREQTLVQQLPAVETLARVDVVCLDKTGTLTHGDLVLDHVERIGQTPGPEVAAALGLLAASSGENPTAAAVARRYPDPGWEAISHVPFSSARKWSAVTTASGTWLLGAPEYLLPMAAGDSQVQVRARAEALATAGRRVLLLARSREHLDAGWSGVEADGTLRLPAPVTAVALVVLSERVRDDAAQTLGFFTEQGVALKVISGDHPRTVGAVAHRVGLPGVAGPADAVDARELPGDLDALADVLEHHSAFGRVSPQQKRAMVAALQRRGHVVAMTGDGVNDALAIKDADIGVAMGSGAPATRALAPLVLLDGRFAHLPAVVAEGRRVIANIERAANLFLVKNIYSMMLAVIVTIAGTAYPLAPIQLTLISVLTIGIPGFVLALGPNRRRYLPGFLTRVLRFTVPTGVVIAACAYGGYVLSRVVEPHAGVAGGRTTATLVVLVVGLWTVLVLARPLAGWKLGLVAGLAGIAAVAVLVPPVAAGVFLLEVTPERLVLAGVLGGLGAGAVEAVWRVQPARTSPG